MLADKMKCFAENQATEPGVVFLLGAGCSRQYGLPGFRELLAWLRAFRHHWPHRFTELLGLTGEACLAQLPEPDDADRFLKFRRIAIANLAGVL